MCDLSDFKDNVRWYDANLSTLLPQYRGKYVGVWGEQVRGAWDDMLSGLNGMADAGYKPGTFIVQWCVPREQEHIGMDVMSLGDMQLTNSQATSFSIRTPSEGDEPFAMSTAI